MNYQGKEQEKGPTPPPKPPKPKDRIECPGCCFEASTKVSLPGGKYKNIEELKVGELVLAWDEASDKVVKGEIVEIVSPKRSDLVELQFGEYITTVSTMDHPFYVEGKGWASVSPDNTKKRYDIFKDRLIYQLEVGDICSSLFEQKTKSIPLLKINSIAGKKQKVYNLRIRNYNTYFANGVLTHNK